MIICPNCQRENTEDTQICVCGELLVKAGATTVIEHGEHPESEPRFGAIRFRENLILDIVDGNTQFIFDRSQVDELWIGRKDSTTGISPQVDLQDAGGEELGVSRRHVKIMRRDGTLHVVDNNSSNGTFLNGQKLIAQQPRVLRDGDELRLGRLVLRVTLS